MLYDREVLDDLLAQENLLTFPEFSHGAGIQIGQWLLSRAQHETWSLAIEVHAYNQIVFGAATDGTVPDNVNWVRRKRNTVLRFGHSSLYMGAACRKKGIEFGTKHNLNLEDYAAHGGGFPLRLATGGLIGAVTVSGLAQHEDHHLVVDALSQAQSNI